MPTKPKARPRKPAAAGAPGASLTQRVRGSKLALLAVAAAIAAIAGVVTWQVEAIWETIGYGAAAAAAMAVVVVIALARRHLLGEHWYRFLGVLFLGFTTWGALAFYLPESGALAEGGLGGSFGALIIGERIALGVLRLVGLGVVGLALLSPAASRAAAFYGARGTAAAGRLMGSGAAALGASAAEAAERRRQRRAAAPPSPPPSWRANDDEGRRPLTAEDIVDRSARPQETARPFPPPPLFADGSPPRAPRLRPSATQASDMPQAIPLDDYRPIARPIEDDAANESPPGDFYSDDDASKYRASEYDEYELNEYDADGESPDTGRERDSDPFIADMQDLLDEMDALEDEDDDLDGIRLLDDMEDFENEDDLDDFDEMDGREEAPAVAAAPSADAASYLGETAGDWRLPAVELLDHAPVMGPSGIDNESKARAIEDALASYNIEAKVVEINPGPAVTQFGIEPGWVRRFKEVRVKDADGKQLLDEHGRPVVRRDEVSRTRVKVDAIANLDKDLALALAASSIRIEAPIPGKPLVGVEVPNEEFEFVSLRGVIESPLFAKQRAKTKLAVALGKGSGGDHEVADLAKMPHILIAGSTGSGKSVSINALLASLLMQATPQDLRLILIDPKRVEMAPYASLPHLLMPVILDVDKVVSALRWAINEMDERYKKFSSIGARNIVSYNDNKKVVDPLPYIVIAIDELADLMMAAPYDVEHALTRLAQLGRATGIHLIVATQRPSVDVVTGLIKANFPTRMSFAVSSVTDSRTILDTGGAEKLLGKGDSLYLPQDAPKPKRVQGVFVSDRELERIIRAWNSQNTGSKPAHVRVDSGDEDVPPGPPPAAAPASGGPGPDAPDGPPEAKPLAHPTLSEIIADDEAMDPLYEEAKAIAERASNVSPSLLQRRLRIGYNKARSLIEMLEEEGLIEPAA